MTTVSSVAKPLSVQVQVQVLLFLEDDTWIAYCPALELSSYGENKVDAAAAFNEALAIFLEEASRKGTLERYLLKLGWQLQQKPKIVYNQPVFSLQKTIKRFLKNPQVINKSIAFPIA